VTQSQQEAQQELVELQRTLNQVKDHQRVAESEAAEDHQREIQLIENERNELRQAVDRMQKQSLGLQQAAEDRAGLIQRYDHSQEKLTELQASYDKLRITHRQCLSKDQHEAALKKLDDKVTRLSKSLKTERAERREEQAAAAEAKDLAAEKALKKASSKHGNPKWLLAKRPDDVDDLKKIYGVGPVMEKTLNKLGIYLFRQVAALRKKDVEWVASHINTFPDRINRDDWVGQATELRREKYGR